MCELIMVGIGPGTVFGNRVGCIDGNQARRRPGWRGGAQRSGGYDPERGRVRPGGAAGPGRAFRPRRPVASPATAWRVLDGIDAPALARVCGPSMTVADLTRATDGHPAAIVIELLQDHASRSHARHDSGLDRIHLPRRRFPRRAMG